MFVVFSLGILRRIIIEINDGFSFIAIFPHISATAPYAGRLITSCPCAVPKRIGRSAIISIALWNPSLGGGTPLLERSEVRVECSGASGGASGLGLTLFALSTFGATGGANASVGPGFGPSCFAGVACFATGVASTLNVAGATGAFCAGPALRGVTARAFCFSSGA